MPGDPRLASVLAEQVRFRFAVPPDRLAARIAGIAAEDAQDALELARRLRLDDLYLALACADGDADAWRECEVVHFPFIRDFAGRYLPDAAARDLADEVIADLWRRRKIASFEGRSSLRTWLGTVVAHSALNAIKARRPVASLDDPDEEGERARVLSTPSRYDAPEDRHARATLTGLIAGALARLGDADKLLLQLYYEQGLTLDEMQIAIRASKATLSRRLKQVRDDIRAAVEQDAVGALGLSVDRLREGLDLGQLELDLTEVFRSPRAEERPRDAV